MQQFPFTLRQLVDETRVQLQDELLVQKKLADEANQNTPSYSSGEVLTLYHEAAGRALVQLAEASYAEPIVQTLMKEIQQHDRKVAALQRKVAVRRRKR
jgi:hypothetical protein